MIAPLSLAFAVLEHPDDTATPAVGRLLAEVDESVLPGRGPPVPLRGRGPGRRPSATATAPLLPWPTAARYPARSWP
ncbi:hypothetical protein ACFXPY_07260 [Streptomyces sp. NPDC059153]|uniref:hypothetical protein n=1 Tax=unclassified Streptomyces TaxID=2593676 RepID=UPI003688EA59